MAQQSRSDLLALALEKLPDNTSRAITPAFVRDVIAALVESGLNLEDDPITVTDGAITFAKLAANLVNGAVADGATNKLTTGEQVKNYVEGQGYATSSTLSAAASDLADAIAACLERAGGTMTGALVLAADPTSALHAATKQYVDTADALAVPKTGTDMTGQLGLVGDPTLDKHAARKKYVDDAIATVNAAISTAVAGMKWKDAARAVITGSEALSGTYTTADGVALAVGDRVVRNSASTQTNNGIWVVASGSWNRASDANTGTLLKQATIAIMEGTSYADKILMCSNDGTITLGSTNITWVTIGQATSYSAGTGLSLSGTVFSVDSTVQLRTTTVATQSGSAISFDSPRQDLTTSSGGSGTAISITSFTNTGIGKRVLWMITSQHASDSLSISVSGTTIYNQGFSFIPNVVNLVYLTHIGTNTYTLTISPNV